MGLGFLWYVTKVLLLQLKIKWAGLLFLCRGKKSPSVTPPLPPSDSPERTSVGAPDLYPHPPSSTHSSLSLLLNLSLHLRLQCNSSWGAKVLLLWCLQIRVHSFFLFFFWPPAQEPDERLHHRETAESNQRQELFHRINSIFLTVLWGLTSVRKYVHLYP